MTSPSSARRPTRGAFDPAQRRTRPAERRGLRRRAGQGGDHARLHAGARGGRAGQGRGHRRGQEGRPGQHLLRARRGVVALFSLFYFFFAVAEAFNLIWPSQRWAGFAVTFVIMLRHRGLSPGCSATSRSARSASPSAPSPRPASRSRRCAAAAPTPRRRSERSRGGPRGAGRAVAAPHGRRRTGSGSTSPSAGPPRASRWSLLLHGFPEFWWSWRHQLTALGSAGYRVVARDLRGYCGSDRPPRGYDLWTLAGDVAGLVRALGARRATSSAPAGAVRWPGRSPRCTRGWSAASPWSRPAPARPAPGRAPPPVALGGPAARRRPLPAPARSPSARCAATAPRASRPADERRGRGVAAGPRSSPGSAEGATAAMRVPALVALRVEYFRWAVRSQFRPDGRRFAAAVDRRSRCRCCTSTVRTTRGCRGRRGPGLGAAGRPTTVRRARRRRPLPAPGAPRHVHRGAAPEPVSSNPCA